MDCGLGEEELFMIQIAGYTITTQLYESRRTHVYRAHRNRDEQPVILKMLKSEYPTLSEIAHYRREYDMTHTLDVPGVIHPYGIEQYQHAVMIVFEDIGGESLSRLRQTRIFPLTEYVTIIVKMAEILDALHGANVIHKDINPSHIVFNPETGQLKLIDFGIASVLSRETPTLKSPTVLEGTLAYMSPEQTGRMNRVIDYRTDFYALGVTCYELLTGQLPFQCQDPLEFVHCHTAKQPVPPHEINPNIPVMVSTIVCKLMAKNAEDRYQSGYGLKYDLEKAREGWEEGTVFQLGQHDFSGKFTIPQKLYGREQELHTILQAFEQVSQGAKELLIVAGYAGVGKSALVHEVQKPITAKRGYFIDGKFDQLQRDVPYYAWIQVFTPLVNQWLTESEAELAIWKRKILDALGSLGQVLIDVIPNLERLIGVQPDVPELGGKEAQNRFQYVFRTFLHAIAQPEHPLVIFLDDLQWVDAASLHLLKIFMTDPASHSMLMIGAYRDNEVHRAHPFMLTLEEIRKECPEIQTITLHNLSADHVRQLIAEALNTPNLQDVHTLAEVVYQKTQGNAFFVMQFLKSLADQKLLAFDVEQQQWQWNMAAIHNIGMADDVVELMATQVQKLPADTQHILKLAACVGNRFDLKLLAIIAQMTETDIARNLQVSLMEGLIIPLGEEYQFADVADPRLVTYEFAHDRIRQAVYSLIADEEKTQVHWQIGNILRTHLPKADQADYLFDIVNQLNQGRVLLNNQTVRDELAALNLQAGKKAKAAAAYQPAFRYLQVGLDVLGPTSWQTHYGLTLALHTEAAEAAYLSGEFHQADVLIEQVIGQAQSLLDQVPVYEIRIKSYEAQHKLVEAIKSGLEILRQLGMQLPEKPSKFYILRNLTLTKLILLGKKIEDLVNLPLMTDQDKQAMMRILIGIGTPSYIAVPELMPVVVFHMVNLSVKYGNARGSAFAYASYGLILCGFTGEFEAGYRFGQLALNLLNREQAWELKAKIYFIFNSFIKHWKDHAAETVQAFRDIYQVSLETGDLVYTAYSASLYSIYGYFIGQELNELNQNIAAYSEAIRQLKHETILNWMYRQRQATINLLQPYSVNAPVWNLIGEAYNEHHMLPLLQQANDRSGILGLHLAKLSLAYLFEQYQEAFEQTVKAEKYLDSVIGMLHVPFFYFYDSLARLAIYPQALAVEQRRIFKRVAANQKKMRKWARHAPMNHQHRYALIAAEQCRVVGKSKDAAEWYAQAIALAQQHHYLHEEALAQELAGKFYLAQGQPQFAQVCLRDARNAYQQWGATAKVQHLEAHYPQVFATSVAIPAISETESPTSQALDMNTIFKASQALSGEIVLSKLLTRMMRMVIENAGAERGVLILEHDAEWVIEAEGTIDQETVSVLQSIPLQTFRTLIPLAVINYTINTQEPVVLNDASTEQRFSQDPYIVTHRPKSVLCIPLLYQSKLRGMMYLENKLTTSAFTPARVNVLTLLCSQAVVAIDNARFYNQLEASEKKYRSLYENAVEGIFQTTPEGRAISANPALYKILGYEPSDDMLSSITNLATQLYVNAEDRDNFRRLLNEKGMVVNFETQLYCKDGTVIWGSLNARSVRDPQGKVLLYEGTLIEITEHKRAEQELEQHHAQLEELVKQRTTELVAINKELQQEIAERKRAEETLRESEERYRILIEESSDPIFSFTPDGTYQYVNKVFAEPFRKKPEDIIGKTLWDLFSQADADARYRAVKNACELGETQVIEVRVPTPERDLFFLTTVKPIKDEHGNVISIICISKNITERKGTEDALRESQQQFQASYQREQQRHQLSETLREVATIVSSTLEQRKVVVLILDQLKKVMTYDYANVLLLQGENLTRIIRRNILGDLFEPLTIPATLYSTNATVLRDKHPIVLPDVSKDARWKPSSETAEIRSFLNTPLLVQDRPIGVLCVGRNDEIPYTEDDAQTVFAFATQVAIAIENARLVEQTQRAMTELQETLENLRKAQKQLIESEKMATLGQLIAGIAHEINTPLGAIRASVTNITGALNETIHDLPCLLQQLPPWQQEAFWAFVARATQGKPSLTSREERQRKRSLRVTLETQGIKSADIVADVLVDIGIYDDIEPFVSLLQGTHTKELLHAAYNLATQYHNNQNVLAAVERMAKIMFALKTYSHYTPTEQKTEARITDGIEVVLTLYHNQLKHGIEVVKHYADIPPILCYPDELNQVWTNLISNAIHAMQGKGRLEITVSTDFPLLGEGMGGSTDSKVAKTFQPTLIPSQEGNKSGILVQFTDSGGGIPEKIKDRIFEPFFTTKSAGEGSGLGLDICKKIINKHQGKIECTSRPGKTTFRVWLPITEENSL
jgi:PAS domain S-box-containing protein